jgi:hypothetical protein
MSSPLKGGNPKISSGGRGGRCRNHGPPFVLSPSRPRFRSTAFMAPRANWKGFLRLSLVTCPVALYPATSESEKISFNQLNRATWPPRQVSQGGFGYLSCCCVNARDGHVL